MLKFEVAFSSKSKIPYKFSNKVQILQRFLDTTITEKGARPNNIYTFNYDSSIGSYTMVKLTDKSKDDLTIMHLVKEKIIQKKLIRSIFRSKKLGP